MTFTTKVKEEITKNEVDKIASLVELSSFLRYSANITKNKISKRYGWIFLYFNYTS